MGSDRPWAVVLMNRSESGLIWGVGFGLGVFRGEGSNLALMASVLAFFYFYEAVCLLADACRLVMLWTCIIVMLVINFLGAGASNLF